MVTLLIVSLALAAAAPIMSKSIKNQSRAENFPVGMVAFFNTRECPTKWRPVQNDYDGRYIRITTDRNKVGTLQGESLPNITGEFGQDNNLASHNNFFDFSRETGAFSYRRTNEVGTRPDDWDAGRISFDASASIRQLGAELVSPYGADRSEADPSGLQSEVRPATLVLLACVHN